MNIPELIKAAYISAVTVIGIVGAAVAMIFISESYPKTALALCVILLFISMTISIYNS